MAREIKVGSYVKVVEDKDSGMLVGRAGTVTSLANDKIWVQFGGPKSLALPFSVDELKPANRTNKVKE
jgi:hypothetical protein